MFVLLQVYTVGPDYAHAEARKSPALDGKVERDSEGKEIRYPVMLTAMEKLVARKVCLAFKVRWAVRFLKQKYRMKMFLIDYVFWASEFKAFFFSFSSVKPVHIDFILKNLFHSSKQCVDSTFSEPTATRMCVMSMDLAL